MHIYNDFLVFIYNFDEILFMLICRLGTATFRLAFCKFSHVLLVKFEVFKFDDRLAVVYIHIFGVSAKSILVF